MHSALQLDTNNTHYRLLREQWFTH